MQTNRTTFGSGFSQVAWVVPDIVAAEKFFTNVLGISSFTKLEHLQSRELEGRYYGEPDNYVFHLYMAYSGGSLLELIQPISGQSIFQEYLDEHPQGGIQHIAYSVPEAQFEKAVNELIDTGHNIVQSLNLPVARVAFFDTRKDIGVMTEIIGLTDAGVEFVGGIKKDAAA